MSEDQLAGSNTSGGTATLEAPAPEVVTPTSTNILEQANSVAAATEAAGPIPDAPQDILNQAADVVAEAQATGGNLPADGALPPASETNINQFNPLTNPDTNQAAGSIADKRTNEKETFKTANTPTTGEKKGGFFGFLGKLNPVKASYENPNAKKEGKMPEAKVVSPGLGLAPAVPEVAPLATVAAQPAIIEVPEGANEALKTGQTPDVPLVSAEAKQAEADASKVLGGNAELPNTIMTSSEMDEAMKASNRVLVEPAPGPATEFAGTSAQPPSDELEAPVVPTAVVAAEADAPATPGLETAAEAPKDETTPEEAHPEIVAYDQNVAETAGLADDAANQSKNDGPNIDLLSTKPTTDNILDQANSVASQAEANGPIEETPKDVISQASDVVSAAEDAGSLPSDGASAPAVENPILATANDIVSRNESIGGALPSADATASSDALPSTSLTKDMENAGEYPATIPTTGDTPIESVANPLPSSAPSAESQWSASNLPTSDTQPEEAPTTSLTQDMEKAGEYPTIPDVTTAPPPEEVTNITPINESVTTGQVQTAEQIAAATSGVAPTLVVEAPSEAVATAIPDVTIEQPGGENAVQTNGDFPGINATPKAPNELPVVPAVPFIPAEAPATQTPKTTEETAPPPPAEESIPGVSVSDGAQPPTNVIAFPGASVTAETPAEPEEQPQAA